MEWNRGSGPNQSDSQPVNHTGSTQSKKDGKSMLNLRVASVGLLFCITILVLALVGYVAFGGPVSQHKYVEQGKYQAVFLNGGQVYFGKITTLNDKFVRLNDIYYLRVNQQVQPDGSTKATNQDISLVKLGCELHGPQDNMVINQSQVIFWENLKADGQVAKAVADFQKQNPKGQNCAANANTSNTNSTTGTGTSTPAATPTTKKQ